MLFGNLSQLDCTPSSTRYYCSCYYMRLNEHRIITIQIQRVYLSETTNEDTNEHTNICNIQSNDFSIDISFNHFFVSTNLSWYMIHDMFFLNQWKQSATCTQQSHRTTNQNIYLYKSIRISPWINFIFWY